MYLQYIYISTAASPVTSSRAGPTATARRTEPGARTCCRSANVSNTCLKPRVTCGEQRATCHGSEDVMCQFLWIQFFSLLSTRYCPAKEKVNNSDVCIPPITKCCSYSCPPVSQQQCVSVPSHVTSSVYKY